MSSPWLFANNNNDKLTFNFINEIIVDKLENLAKDDKHNLLGLKDHNIREYCSINRSFRRGSSTAAQLANVATEVVELINCWKKIERAKGKQPSFMMIET